jgi:hypothetical protein
VIDVMTQHVERFISSQNVSVACVDDQSLPLRQDCLMTSNPKEFFFVRI